MTLPQTLPRQAPCAASHATDNLFVVATDGSSEADPAFELANLLACSKGAVLGVAVAEPIDLVPESGVPVSAEIATDWCNELRERVDAQMSRTLGRRGKFEIYDGDPARLISQTASRVGASMILAGIGRHDVAARIFGNETVLRIMRMSSLPVLAVARDMRNLPRRIVAAIDFSEPSIRASQLAATFAAQGATVALVHVMPRDSALNGWSETYRQNVVARLDALRNTLTLPVGALVSAVLLQGDPATELLAHARRIGADLIATGSHGRGFIARLLLGSVATRLVRGSMCSVLSVPHRLSRELSGCRNSRSRELIPSHWSALLDEVSQRNAGRLIARHEDAMRFDTHADDNLLAFMGATYDPYDGQVQLMLASGDGLLSHYTRTMRDISAIEVIRNDDGCDVAVRIDHRDGQTVLSFCPDAADF